MYYTLDLTKGRQATYCTSTICLADNPLISGGAELLVDVPFINASIGLEGTLSDGDSFGVRLEGSTLIFPALGSNPPAALGLGSDLSWSDTGSAVHAGPLLGTDLLFVFDVPMVVSVYLAPGYASNEGFSFAWAALIRYYFDDYSLELSNSDTYLLGLAIRFGF